MPMPTEFFAAISDLAHSKKPPLSDGLPASPLLEDMGLVIGIGLGLMALLMLLLRSPFLATMQLLLYAGAIVVLHDISELRQLEKVRRDFIANISHELKTPLAAIRGLVETLIDDKEMEGDTHDRFLDKIRAQSNRLSNLVTDLLTISRLESDDAEAQLELVDFREPVAESYRNLSSVADAQQVTIETTVPDHPVDIRGDRESLRGLVDNLLDNAIKYTGDGGRVQISIRPEAPGVVVAVSDSGRGIPRDELPRVFDRFYRSGSGNAQDREGSGLGLAIAEAAARPVVSAKIFAE